MMEAWGLRKAREAVPRIPPSQAAFFTCVYQDHLLFEIRLFLYKMSSTPQQHEFTGPSKYRVGVKYNIIFVCKAQRISVLIQPT